MNKYLGRTAQLNFPPNVIRNQKYSIFTFIPLVLYNQVKYCYDKMINPFSLLLMLCYQSPII